MLPWPKLERDIALGEPNEHDGNLGVTSKRRVSTDTIIIGYIDLLKTGTAAVDHFQLVEAV